MKKLAQFVLLVACMFLVAKSVLAVKSGGESLGGIKPNDSANAVIKMYGNPESKSKGEYRYPSKGLIFSLSDNRINSIKAFGASTAKTRAGIHIGSTRAQVKAAYPGIEDVYTEDPNRLSWEDCVSAVGSDITFTFTADKVSEIFLFGRHCND